MQVQQVGVLSWRLRRVFKNRKLSPKFHVTNFLLFDALTPPKYSNEAIARSPNKSYNIF